MWTAWIRDVCFSTVTASSVVIVLIVSQHWPLPHEDSQQMTWLISNHSIIFYSFSYESKWEFRTLVNIVMEPLTEIRNYCYTFFELLLLFLPCFLITKRNVIFFAQPPSPEKTEQSSPKKTPKPHKTQNNPATPAAPWPQSMFMDSHGSSFLVPSWRAERRVSQRIQLTQVNCININPNTFQLQETSNNKKNSCQISHCQSPTRWSF